MRRSNQRGYINLPNLIPIFIFALIGICAMVGGVVWLVRFLIQHLNWI